MSDQVNIKLYVTIIALGITIGMASISFVKSIVQDLIMSLVYSGMMKASGSFSKETVNFLKTVTGTSHFRIANFINEFITWLLVIIIAIAIYSLIRKIQNTHWVRTWGEEKFSSCPPCPPCPSTDSYKINQEFQEPKNGSDNLHSFLL